MVKLIFKTKPIGVNQLYRGRRFLTKDGKAAKEATIWEAMGQWKRKPIEDDVCLNVIFYFKDKRGLDIDGGLKSLFDCLTGVVWKDDKQVTEAHVFKMIDKDNPRIELTVLE